MCRQLPGVETLYASDLELSDSGLVFAVRPRLRKPRCSGFGRYVSGYERRPAREWCHIAVGSTVLWLRYAPWRVACADCAMMIKQVPWGGDDRSFQLPQAPSLSHGRGRP